MEIIYPNSEIPTKYCYGDDSNINVKANGKVLSVTDESGIVSFEYGKLGEVIKETRVLNSRLDYTNPNKKAVMEYRSDYLGRMQYIKYPDNEYVVYSYDRGGLVNKVTGFNYGHVYNYVEDIKYDAFGQRTSINYGNGVQTEYKYDKKRRWLESIYTAKDNNHVYQNINYFFDCIGNITKYENNCLNDVNGNYYTKQCYEYDSLYQLIKVNGESVYNQYRISVPDYKSQYEQCFEFDKLNNSSMTLGNMISKKSTHLIKPYMNVGDDINYDLDYEYDDEFAHRAKRIGNRYYKYDANGNVVEENEEVISEKTEYYKTYVLDKDDEKIVNGQDYEWGAYDSESKNIKKENDSFRYYSWNSRNMLSKSVDNSNTVYYVYDYKNVRTGKYSNAQETLYFNKMWTIHRDNGNMYEGGQTAKNIYLGDSRIVTKLNRVKNPAYMYEYNRIYFYHSDHLNSASLITDYNGDEYQRIEYTPYGETWIEKTSNVGSDFLPYKFTAQEKDNETGLYYYGARYLDPKYCRWISTDPALGDYIPAAGKGNSQDAGNLPGMGGVYNHINFHLYHYAGNNPVKYVDPDGNETVSYEYWKMMKNVTSGADKFFSSVMQYIVADKPSLKINPDYLISKLDKTTYRDFTNEVPSFKSQDSYKSENSFLLTGNLAKNLATALPSQTDATLEDTVDIKGGYSAGVLGLSVASKMTRGIGNITFNYTLTNGKVSDWSLTEKTTDGKNILYHTYTKSEAIEYLKQNRDKIYDKSKEFKKVLSNLD